MTMMRQLKACICAALAIFLQMTMLSHPGYCEYVFPVLFFIIENNAGKL